MADNSRNNNICNVENEMPTAAELFGPQPSAAAETNDSIAMEVADQEAARLLVAALIDDPPQAAQKAPKPAATDTPKNANSATVAPEWEPPARFDEYKLPAFPVEHFPQWLRDFCREKAIETQTPIDLAATMALGALAGALGGKFLFTARPGWVEPANLYLCCALPPGNRKTAIYQAIVEPFAALERELIEKQRPIIRERQLEREAIEERIKHLKIAAAKTDNSTERAQLVSEMKDRGRDLEEIIIPPMPKLIVSGDSTPESIGIDLAEQDGRLTMMSDEGELFDVLAGRYSSGTPNIQNFLKAHTGSDIRVNRAKQVYVTEHAFLTIAVAVQPDVIRGLAQQQQFRGRGLLGRFLYSLPVSTVGARQIGAAAVQPKTANEYTRCLRALAALERPSDAFFERRLSRDANQALATFERNLEPKMAEGREMAVISDWAGKLAGAIVRIAGLLHVADFASQPKNSPEEIPLSTFERAEAIGRYFAGHARAAFAEMGADPEIDAAKYILRWLERTKPEDVTKRDIFEGTKARFKKVDAMEPALRLLEAHGYIRTMARGEEPERPGRKASQLYALNPALLEQYSHNSQNGHFEADLADSANCANTAPKDNSFGSGGLAGLPVAKFQAGEERHKI
ncbi:MAG: YfjI family protein [Blastocatellia bacterium]|nr:YfjI family protein [Blastocatellia bacterium]